LIGLALIYQFFAVIREIEEESSDDEYEVEEKGKQAVSGNLLFGKTSLVLICIYTHANALPQVDSGRL
jgi:hypothetical protein